VREKETGGQECKSNKTKNLKTNIILYFIILNIIFKRVSFLLLFILYIIVDSLYKILYFFNLILNFFFDALVLIKDILILIFYKKNRIKKKETKMKKSIKNE
jgi:hypothetical protein